MPKSRLKIEGLQLSDIESIQATRTKLTVNMINNIKVPSFIQEIMTPSIRAMASLQTDEVEYDTYVRWVVTRLVMLPPFTDVDPHASQVTLETTDSANNFSIPFGNPIDVDWPSGTYVHMDGSEVSTQHLYQGTLVRSQALVNDWTIEGDLSVYVYDTAGTNIGHLGQVLFGVGSIDSDFIGVGVNWSVSKYGGGYSLVICRYDNGSPSYSTITTRNVTSGPIDPPTTGLVRITKEGTKYTVEFNSDEYGYYSDSKTFASEQEVYVMSAADNDEYSILDGLFEIDDIRKIG